MPEFIELNEAERKLARYLARERHARNRQRGTVNARIGPQDDEQTDLEGIAAEIAFAKLMNVYPDTQLEVCERADAYTTRLGGVDVKTTTYPRGQLLVRPTKAQHPADSYALMVGTFPRYAFVGWVSASEIMRPENLKDLGHGETYALPQEKLRDA